MQLAASWRSISEGQGFLHICAAVRDALVVLSSSSSRCWSAKPAQQLDLLAKPLRKLSGLCLHLPAQVGQVDELDL